MKQALEQADTPDAPAKRPKTLGKLRLPTDPPPLVPARIVNEVLYCERLAYLEWAQGEFDDNAYTVDGRLVHRNVDARPGALPDADDEDDTPPPFAVRSLWLSSETLGITAKIDLVEGEGGESGKVLPVEMKRGRSPNNDEGAYLPERAQVCVQALLLREQGHVCDEGAIWFAKDRRRVRVVIDARLVSDTLDAIARAKEVCARGVIPPPLVDSPKCKGCSLVGICLPDETTLLRGLAGEPLDLPPKEDEYDRQLALFGPDIVKPDGNEAWGISQKEPEFVLRRLHAARDERLPIYVHTQGARVVLDGELLKVQGGDKVIEARLPNTSHVVLYGNVQVSTQALGALLDRDIPVLFFSIGGWYRGRTVGHGTKNVELRVAQHRVFADEARKVELARALVAAKIRNQRTLLRRNHEAPDPVVLGELDMLARKAEGVASIESLLGLEGTAARYYFGAFSGMLKGAAALGDFDLEGRNRRPPKDPTNALLSFAYSLLAKDCALACAIAGLDPLLGALHAPRFGRPALALDLMEEMRPLVADSTVVTALNTGVVVPGDFIRAGDGVSLGKPGRKRFIESYERRVDQLITHPTFGYRLSYRRVFEVQARLLGRWLLGEIEAYPAFRTR